MAGKKPAVKKLATLDQAFEKSGFDKEPKGMKEDSPADKKLDAKQMKAWEAKGKPTAAKKKGK